MTHGAASYATTAESRSAAHFASPGALDEFPTGAARPAAARDPLAAVLPMAAVSEASIDQASNESEEAIGRNNSEHSLEIRMLFQTGSRSERSAPSRIGRSSNDAPNADVGLPATSIGEGLQRVDEVENRHMVIVQVHDGDRPECANSANDVCNVNTC